jgi:uncharacterized protein YdeI (YjbR/CyaY-like superfamily)
MKFRAIVELSGKAATGIEVPAEIIEREPRDVIVPSDFAAALDNDAAARAAFDKMPNSHKQRWILSITSAKAPETRERRVTKAIEAIRAG